MMYTVMEDMEAVVIEAEGVIEKGWLVEEISTIARNNLGGGNHIKQYYVERIFTCVIYTIIVTKYIQKRSMCLTNQQEETH